MLSGGLDVRNETIEKAGKRYKIEKEEKPFQRNGWSRKKALRRNLKKDFRKVCIFHSMKVLRMARSIFAERNLVKVYSLPGNTG